MVALSFGRTLTVDGDDVEIRDAAGTLELRVRVTEDGIVLQLEGARISLKAEQSIDLECDSLNVDARSDVRIRGERIYLN